MPLGRSVEKNIKTLIEEGFSQDQAVAIAKKESRKQRRKNSKRDRQR